MSSLKRLGELPLIYQRANAGSITPAPYLGVLIARAAGLSFGNFMAERSSRRSAWPIQAFMSRTRRSIVCDPLRHRSQDRRRTVFDAARGGRFPSRGVRRAAPNWIPTADDYLASAACC